MTNSVNNVAKAQQSQIITNRVLSSILLGATQQISCSSCGGGFGSLARLPSAAGPMEPLRHTYAYRRHFLRSVDRVRDHSL